MMYYIVEALVAIVVEPGEPAAIVKSASKINAYRICPSLFEAVP